MLSGCTNLPRLSVPVKRSLQGQKGFWVPSVQAAACVSVNLATVLMDALGSLVTGLIEEIRTDFWGDTGQFKRLPVKWKSRQEQRACPSSDNSRARGACGV